MKNKAKRSVFGLVFLLTAGLTALNLLAWNHARSMMCYTEGGTRTPRPESLSLPAKARVLLLGVNIPRPASARSAMDLAPDCRRLSITTPDHVLLTAWYSDRGEDSPLAILFHGYSAEKSSLLNEARTMLDIGASVLLVDFRGSGESSESYTTLGVHEADDVAAAVRHAEQELPHSALILYGQSMGAVAILRAVHVHGIRPDAVILEAVFDTMLNTVRNRFEAMRIPSFPSAQLLVFWGGAQNGFNGFAHNPVEYAASLQCPSLFMHGVNDPRARLSEGRRVFDAARGPKQFLEFQAVGHEAYASRYPEDWRAAVAGIITEVEGL